MLTCSLYSDTSNACLHTTQMHGSWSWNSCACDVRCSCVCTALHCARSLSVFGVVTVWVRSLTPSPMTATDGLIAVNFWLHKHTRHATPHSVSQAVTKTACIRNIYLAEAARNDSLFPCAVRVMRAVCVHCVVGRLWRSMHWCKVARIVVPHALLFTIAFSEPCI